MLSEPAPSVGHHARSAPPTTLPTDPSPKELAQAKLRARAARIARMRKRVIAASLATFALAFGAIAVDGSMGATSSASSGTQTTASSSSGSSTLVVVRRSNQFVGKSNHVVG